MPEELAGPYRATLTKLQDAAPPMPSAIVHKVLAERAGPPLAAAVPVLRRHPGRGRLDRPGAPGGVADGREVAVKVQYPGAGRALISDLNQVSRVARVSAGWIPGLDIKPLVDELSERMAEELDYTLEARRPATPSPRPTRGPRLRGARCRDQAEHVLVASGWTACRCPRSSPTAPRRSATPPASATSLPLRLPRPGRPAARRPAPGNYRLLPDGRLGVLDYGAVARLPGRAATGDRAAAPVALAGDAEDVLAGLRAEGFIKPVVESTPRPLLDYLAPFLEPATHDTFHFIRAWMRAQFNAHQRPPAARSDRRAEAQPAAGVPADPPGLAGRDRRAVPDRGHRCRPGHDQRVDAARQAAAADV